MKKIFYSLAILTMVFTSCNPLEDIYNDIDAQTNANAIVGDAIITLTEVNYEDDFSLDNSYFDDLVIAKSMIPSFLSDTYPTWGKNSSVLVNYELKSGTDLESVNPYISSERYSLSNSDYPSAADNATGFYETEDASDFIPNLLANNIMNPEEGLVTLARYNQYVGATVNGINEYYSADFATAETLLDFEKVNVTGAQVWEGTRFGAKMSGFSGGSRYENEDWLISTEIDLTSFPNSTVQINQILNFGSYDDVEILISTDYTGDPATATWDVINLSTVPPGTSWDPVLSEEYSLSAYNGEKINIAFKYTSSNSAAGTWEIVTVTMKAPGVEGDKEFKEVYYSYSGGSWDVDDSYYLSSADYDSMGEANGQPGRFNNFSSSIQPNNYIPAFLGVTFPFAQEKDNMLILFKFYNGSNTEVRGNEFTFTNGTWVAHATQLKFAHDGSTWVPDNTIKYTMVAADYSLVGSTLATEGGYEAAAANLTQYGNFNRTGSPDGSDPSGTSNWNDIMLIKAFGIVLSNIDASAAEGQKYIVKFNLYDGSNDEGQFSMIKTNGEWVLQ